MRRFLSILVAMMLWFSASADERGVERLQRLSRHYASLGNYSLNFALNVAGVEQKGELRVDGNNMYMSLADTEVFVVDSVRYEVQKSKKEIVVDKADLYESELISPLQGLSKLSNDFDIVEQLVEGRVQLYLTPKRSGDAITIVLTVDGEAAERIIYGSGEGAVTLEVERAKKSAGALPKFDIARYNGFEMIDFR